MARSPSTAALFALALACAGPAVADERLYVYESASDGARALAATGLTFEFATRPLGGYKLERIFQTGERGSADLQASSDKDLGPGGLRAALGGTASAGGLYEIRRDAADGRAFVGAVCPGAERAWLVVGPLRRFRDLTVQAIGKDQGAVSARRCVDLSFRFRGELALPPDRPPPTDRVAVGHAP